MKDKINKLASHSKNKNIRESYTRLNEFKKSYQLRTDFIGVENDDSLRYVRNILDT
jgi:hypothetical protein